MTTLFSYHLFTILPILVMSTCAYSADHHEGTRELLRSHALNDTIAPLYGSTNGLIDDFKTQWQQNPRAIRESFTKQCIHNLEVKIAKRKKKEDALWRVITIYSGATLSASVGLLYSYYSSTPSTEESEETSVGRPFSLRDYFIGLWVGLGMSYGAHYTLPKDIYRTYRQVALLTAKKEFLENTLKNQ